MAGPIRLAKIAGIQLSLHWSWFLVVLIELQDRGGVYTSPLWNVFELLALFAIVTLHEFGHVLACRQVGGRADQILLWPFGGIAYVDPPMRPGATLWTIAAGPLVNVALAPLLWFAAGWARTSLWGLQNPNAIGLVVAIEYINFGLLLFNLAPVYPLDGGQILRALLWFPLGRIKSLMTATVLGMVGVVGFFYLAALTSDWWLAAITVFILMYCWSGLKHARRLWKLAKLPQRAGFVCPWCQAAPPTEALWTCNHCRQGFDPFASAGACPYCDKVFAQTQCLSCGHTYPLPNWQAPLPIPLTQPSA